jgi:hypothetical protein
MIWILRVDFPESTEFTSRNHISILFTPRYDPISRVGRIGYLNNLAILTLVSSYNLLSAYSNFEAGSW